MQGPVFATMIRVIQYSVEPVLVCSTISMLRRLKHGWASRNCTWWRRTGPRMSWVLRTWWRNTRLLRIMWKTTQTLCDSWVSAVGDSLKKNIQNGELGCNWWYLVMEFVCFLFLRCVTADFSHCIEWELGMPLIVLGLVLYILKLSTSTDNFVTQTAEILSHSTWFS